MARIAKYKKEEASIKKGKIHICISCHDIIEVGKMKGKFRCPACGWLNNIKD